MLDFRFLIGAILAGVSLVVIGLRAFGPVDPLIATIAERPNIEIEAAPRIVRSHGFIPVSHTTTIPVFVQTPGGAVPVHRTAPEIAAAAEPASRPAVQENAVAVQPASMPAASENTVVPAPSFGPAVGASAAAGDPISKPAVPAIADDPAPSVTEIAGKPAGNPATAEVTGSIDPAAAQAEDNPQVRPKRRTRSSDNKKEAEDLNPVLLFFSRNAKIR